MFKIALCGCPNSAKVIESEISAFLGNAIIDYKIYNFENVQGLMAKNMIFNICFLNKNLRGSADILLARAEKEVNRDKKTFTVLAFVEDPVSSSDCGMILNCITKLLEGSMYIAVEFITDMGLRSIAASRIIFFEFFDRKIKIKTSNAEYFCNGTLKNFMSLVGSLGFYQPHKSFIVNLKHITGIKHYTITMSDGSLIPLSQKKSKEFRKHCKDFLSKC